MTSWRTATGTHSSLQVHASPATSISSLLGNYEVLPAQPCELLAAGVGALALEGPAARGPGRPKAPTRDSAATGSHTETCEGREHTVSAPQQSHIRTQRGFLTLSAELCKHGRHKVGSARM